MKTMTKVNDCPGSNAERLWRCQALQDRDLAWGKVFNTFVEIALPQKMAFSSICRPALSNMRATICTSCNGIDAVCSALCRSRRRPACRL